MSDPVMENGAEVYLHWRNSCLQVLVDDFRNWTKHCEIDFLTGNPIYSLYCPARKKAIRILHIHKQEDQARYGAWIKTTFDPATDHMEETVYELVFTLPYENWATRVFELMFRIWIHPKSDGEFMNQVITRSMAPFEDFPAEE